MSLSEKSKGKRKGCPLVPKKRKDEKRVRTKNRNAARVMKASVRTAIEEKSMSKKKAPTLAELHAQHCSLGGNTCGDQQAAAWEIVYWECIRMGMGTDWLEEDLTGLQEVVKFIREQHKKAKKYEKNKKILDELLESYNRKKYMPDNY
jgi:hypothetical protein